MINSEPFFIIGAGRSGTTLLRLILTSHSRLHIPPETWFLLPLVERLPLTAALTPQEVNTAVGIITGHYRWPDMEIDAHDLSVWAAALESPKLVDIVNLVYYQQVKLSKKERFGDKTPIYFEIVPQLAALYPGAKFIHLIRDGRDVAISHIGLNWKRYYEPNFVWTSAMRHRRTYSNTPYSAVILDIKYEDLIRNAEETIRRVCDFIDEKFERSMLNWQNSVHLVPARERGIHEKLDQSLSPDAIDIWQKKLTAIECFMMESCLYKDLLWAGYRLEYATAPWRPLLAVVGWLLQRTAPLLRRGIPYLQRRRLLPKGIYI